MAIDMKSQFAALSSQINDVKQETKSLKGNIVELDKGMAFLNKEITVMKSETVPNIEKELSAKINALEESRLATELYSKKNNLLFFNIPKTSEDEDTEEVLRTLLSDELDIDNAEDIVFMNVHCLPLKVKRDNVPIPIIAKFVSMRDRNSILSQARTKFSTPRSNVKKYAVAPHLPAKMQAERKRLVTIRNRQTAEGKTAKIRINGTKVQLFVDNAIWKD